MSEAPTADVEADGGSGGEPSAMPAEFGLATATFVVVASMVGVGVMTTSGYTVAAVGSNQLMLLLWVVGGVAALCGALTLAELSAALPRSGGEYVILYEAYGPLAAFLSGWVTLLLGFAAPIAASASAAAAYLLAPLDLARHTAPAARQAVATLAILVLAAIQASGRSRAARVQGTITLLNLALLGLFVVAGLAAGWRRWANLADRPPLDFPVILAMTFSLVYVMYAYFGWNAASFLAGEIGNPARRLPRAILIGTAGVVLLYVGVNAVYALALPAAEIRAIVARGGSVEPIAELAAGRLFGPGWAGTLAVATGLILLSSLGAYLLTGPRVAYAMARAGQFPAVAGRLSPRFRTPSVATGLLVALALILLWTGSFRSLVIYSSVGMVVFSMLTIAAVYVLRWRRPDLERPFKTPGYPVIPAIYLVLSALLTASAFLQSPRISAWSVMSILAGIPAYFLWTRLTRPGRAGVA